MVISCIYRHPTSTISVSDFSNLHLDPILQKIDKENKLCVLLGDFNVDLLKLEIENSASYFFNNMSSHYYTPYILQPTRLGSKTLIDNIFFNSLEYHSNSGNLLYELSDHLIQFLILEGFVKDKGIPDMNIYKRDMSNFNEREFEELVIQGENWDILCDIERNDSNHSFEMFFNNLNYYLDEMTPYRKIPKKENK